MNTVEIVRELDGFLGDACLVRRGHEYFVVSSVLAPMTGYETLAFRADPDGGVTSWSKVAGGRGRSRADVIEELQAG